MSYEKKTELRFVQWTWICRMYINYGIDFTNWIHWLNFINCVCKNTIKIARKINQPEISWVNSKFWIHIHRTNKHIAVAKGYRNSRNCHKSHGNRERTNPQLSNIYMKNFFYYLFEKRNFFVYEWSVYAFFLYWYIGNSTGRGRDWKLFIYFICA